MNVKSEWLTILLAVIGFSVGYGVLQAKVTTLEMNQQKIEKVVESRAQFAVDFASLRQIVAQNSEELKIMRPISQNLQKTLSNLDKTLAKQQVEMSSLKDDIQEIKNATVK